MSARPYCVWNMLSFSMKQKLNFITLLIFNMFLVIDIIINLILHLRFIIYECLPTSDVMYITRVFIFQSNMEDFEPK